ncbi:MAG: hypothetical protein Q7T16_03735 [Candidatus Burarchaeum sp.]|nr:hypothetical protein [Candidatus Burarchaeum sp.]
MKKMRGIAISLDAVMAVTILLVIMAVMSSFARPNANEAAPLMDMRHSEMSALEAMEKTGRLAQALTGNDTAVREVLAASEESECYTLTVVRYATNATALTTVKPDCGIASGQLVYAYRSFAVANETYLARMAGWRKA